MRRAAGWASWGLVCALLALGGTTHSGKRAVERDLAAHVMPHTPGGLVLLVRTYLAQDWDVQRAYAYVSAALGRPYKAFYIRTSEAWAEAFRRDEVVDPDATPLVTPAGPQVPYRDFAVEYPPGFFLWATPPAWVAPGADGYRVTFGLEMALCLTLALLLAERLQRVLQPGMQTSLPAWAAGATLALGVVVMNRLDATVALTVTVAVWAALRGRPALSGLALGVATVTKLVPVVLFPVLAVAWWQYGRRRGLLRAALAFALGALLPAVPFLVAAGNGVLDAMLYQAVRPLQIETSAAVVLGALHTLFGTTLAKLHSYGSLNLQGTGVALATHLTSVLALLGLLALYAWAWRAFRRGGPRAELLLATVLAALVVCFVLGKVFSPQYLVWILPLGALASCLAGRRFCLLLLGVCLLSQAIFPVAYPALAALSPWAFALLGLRNALLLAWALSLLGWATRQARPTSAAP